MPLVTFPSVANLLALPNGWACGLGVSDQRGQSFTDDVYAPISFTTGPLVVSSGWVGLYIITGEEPGRFTDNLNPNGRWPNAAVLLGVATQANQISRIDGLKPLTEYHFNSFSIRAMLGSVFGMTAPVIWNNAGGPLSTRKMPYAAHTVQS